MNWMVRVRTRINYQNKRADPETSGNVFNGLPKYLTTCMVNVVKRAQGLESGILGSWAILHA